MSSSLQHIIDMAKTGTVTAVAYDGNFLFRVSSGYTNIFLVEKWWGFAYKETPSYMSLGTHVFSFFRRRKIFKILREQANLELLKGKE